MDTFKAPLKTLLKTTPFDSGRERGEHLENLLLILSRNPREGHIKARLGRESTVLGNRRKELAEGCVDGGWSKD